jgi:hypothetical protein
MAGERTRDRKQGIVFTLKTAVDLAMKWLKFSFYNDFSQIDLAAEQFKMGDAIGTGISI